MQLVLVSTAFGHPNCASATLSFAPDRRVPLNCTVGLLICNSITTHLQLIQC